jgi:stearoyl-CoA desaturase (delta-9 desaturase)
MQDKTLASVRERGINWGTTSTLIVFHLGAVAALFFWNWKSLVVFAFLYWLTGGLGIGVGFHRLLTHRGYKTPKVVEYFLTICGVLALQGGAINWVATHRMHHAHTDTDGDPHSPRHGSWWSHVGWILTGTSQQHDEATLRRWAPDLMKDGFHRGLNKIYYVPLILLGILLLALGGWPMLLWGIFFRVTFNLHATWLVNSATHMWGRKRFETTDDSRNNWWVALLSFGEGWHNNHHANPTAARHGLRWYEIDFNWWGIRTMQLLGLAKSIKLVDFVPSLLQSKARANASSGMAEEL